MPQSPQRKEAAPAEVLESLNLGYNGYTDPTLTNPKMWANPSINVYSGAFAFIQRARFANILTVSPSTGMQFTSLKYFALRQQGPSVPAGNASSAQPKRPGPRPAFPRHDRTRMFCRRPPYR